MFGLYYRPYVPGLWLDPQDVTPGFNVSDNSSPLPSAMPPSDGDPATGAEYDIQIAPFPTLPDFQLYPQFDLSGFNIGGSGPMPSPIGQADAPQSGAALTPQRRSDIQTDASADVRGPRLYAPDEVPDVNAGLPDDVPDVDFPEDSVGQEDPVWSEQIPPIDEGTIPPALPRFPAESGESATPVPSTLGVLDPLTGRSGAVGPLPVPVPTGWWSPSDLPQWPPATFASSRSSGGQGMGGQPWDFMAYRSPWIAPSTTGPTQAQDAGFQRLQNITAPRLHPDIGPVPGNKPAVGAKFTLEDGKQQAALPGYAQRQSLVSLAPAAGTNSPTKPGAMTRASNIEQGLPRFAAPSRPLSRAMGNTDTANPIRQASPLVEESAAGTRIDSSPRDAAGLPIGTAISAIRAPNEPVRGNVLSPAIRRLIQNYANTVGGASGDRNIHLVGDEDSVRDLSRVERHKLAIRPSVEMHIKRGFEIVSENERNAIVPGFPNSPRRYDYIIKDPVTGRHFGVEVKTTIGETIFLRTQQVLKDAAVVGGGAYVPALNVTLDGVAYTTLCFGCEDLDVRSWVLLRILHNAGVEVARVPYPGVIQR